MRYFISKSGLEVFDTAKAYGLATCLYYGSDFESPTIYDCGSIYLLDHPAEMPVEVPSSAGWEGLFADDNWNNVFRTYKQLWRTQVENVKKFLATCYIEILREFSQPNRPAQICETKGETLPGPLDPTAFKGLRTATKGVYGEGQIKVGATDWVLACLGGALCGKYIPQRSVGNKWEYFAIYWMPQQVIFEGFLDIRNRLKDTRLQYLGIQNAAAHQAVVLAKTVRQQTLDPRKHIDHFSEIAYFTLFQSGQQLKPSASGKVNLSHLMKLALNPSSKAGNVLDIWDYLFRRGSTLGAENLALAITELVMHPSLDTFERHAKIFLRYLPKGIKGEFQYDEETLKEVILLMSDQLSEVYSDSAVKDFGSALRRALIMDEIQDYASLIELENAEEKDDFADAIHKFLRRFESHARKLHLRRPSEVSLERLMALVDQHGVRTVRAALISHALVKRVVEEEASPTDAQD
ncbi:MAG: hypothetical protein QME62_09545 [Armatimonadota bacterium]|nr:hypothetical protein [Armatimonadota bacterium]